MKDNCVVAEDAKQYAGAHVALRLASPFLVFRLYRSNLVFDRNLGSYDSTSCVVCQRQVSFFLQAAGKLRQEGKNYVVQDGDIIEFKVMPCSRIPGLIVFECSYR